MRSHYALTRLCMILAGFAAWIASAQQMMPLVPFGNLTATYVVPLMPSGNDSVTFQRSATSTLLNMFQVELYVGPCAVRVAHFHHADEMILVVNGTLGFVNIEANGTVTDRKVPAGNVIELPKAQIHIPYNPTCETTVYTAVFNLAVPVTVVVPYALNMAGNFTLEAIFSDEGRPQFRYPGSVPAPGRPAGQWAYNPTCLAECGIMLPPNLADVDAPAMRDVMTQSG